MENNIIKIALDAQSGEASNQTIIKALEFIGLLHSKVKIYLFANSELKKEVISSKANKKNIEFIDYQYTLLQDEDIKKVLTSDQSATYKAIELLKQDQVDALVSNAGTGPLVCLSRHMLNTFNLRCALMARIPYAPNQYSFMTDLGANAQCSANDLYDFARLAHIYLQTNFDLKEPKISILNVGTEDKKGNKLVLAAKELIANDKSLNFQGFIEADSIFAGKSDIIITDGFSGNIALKASEGLYRLIQRFKKKVWLFNQTDEAWMSPENFNGSILLGVDKLVIKSHANVKSHALIVAMLHAIDIVKRNRFKLFVDNLKQ